MEAKKEEKRLAFEEYLSKKEAEPKKEETLEEFALKYDLQHNNLFLRIYETTINQLYNNRLIQAMQFGQKLVIDCGYDVNMTKRENMNCAKQFMLLFAENRLHDVSEDPISSTSSDNFDQKPPIMNNKVVGGEIMKVPSSDNVNELLEMPVPNEKITEDVEDLVHDLESLLGKTSQSFDAQIRPKTADDSKSSSDEVTEKIKDDEGIKNNENIESNSSLDISSKETIENKDVNSEEGCNQLEIENKTTEISSQSPTFAKDEIGVEENLPICDNMNTTVDPTIDSKHSNEREPLVSEELSIDTENNSAVDNPLITIEVNKDIISDAKSNEINELTNDDSTSSWEIVDLNEAMALESSVSSTPSDNIEQPVNTIANSQNVLDDITSSGINQEPLSLAKAKREGIRMAKLPLDRYLQWGAGSGKSLTLNQVVAILLDQKVTGDWQHSLRHVPKRKLMEESTLRAIEQTYNRRKQTQFKPQWKPKSSQNVNFDNLGFNNRSKKSFSANNKAKRTINVNALLEE
uniref:Uncharacterized protein LOC114341316 n=1 Tax=Diabrotica virgifera virgifera TaxID=50390 RepID=A0A6P7GVL4_DIAVI